MGIYAMIVDGVVENLAIWDGETEWTPGDQYTLIEMTPDLQLEIGDEFTMPKKKTIKK